MIAPKPEISAIVVCFNEGENIRACLECLKWCDEIVVVDSFSTDRTVEICSASFSAPGRGIGTKRPWVM